MSQKKRSLGRGLNDLGLSALLSDMQSTNTLAITPSSLQPPEKESALNLELIPIDKIHPGSYQPRSNFDQEALEELAKSIRSQGLIQPIILRRRDDGYEIIAGERRWRAAQLANLSSMPAIIREVPDQAVVAMTLIENIQRRDLNAIEEANALQRLIVEFHLTHQEVAEAVGKSRTLVTNLLRLLKLNPDVRSLVEQNRLEMGHARALLALGSEQQSDAAHYVISQALSVRQTESWVRRLQNLSKNETSKTTIDPDVRRLQNRLSEKLGAQVTIRHSAKGKGKLVVHYYSLEELDGILEKFS